jgi:hypothetical protein
MIDGSWDYLMFIVYFASRAGLYFTYNLIIVNFKKAFIYIFEQNRAA